MARARLTEEARKQAPERMRTEAAKQGGDAAPGFRFATPSAIKAAVEVLACRTSVRPGPKAEAREVGEPNP